MGLQAQGPLRGRGRSRVRTPLPAPEDLTEAIDPATVELIVEVRQKLTTARRDAGPDTIAWHLEHHHATSVSVATISRYLTKAQLIRPQPNKRPKSSYVRFQATLPNETWQSAFTHYRLTTGTECEVISWRDDHRAIVYAGPDPLTGSRADAPRSWIW